MGRGKEKKMGQGKEKKMGQGKEKKKGREEERRKEGRKRQNAINIDIRSHRLDSSNDDTDIS